MTGATHAHPPLCPYRVWTDRPGWPCKPVRVHTLDHAGVSVVEKLAALAKELAVAGADALVVNDLAEIAWLTNLRGADVDCNPVFVAYAIVRPDGATLFVHDGAVDSEVEGYLKVNGVEVAAYDKVAPLPCYSAHSSGALRAISAPVAMSPLLHSRVAVVPAWPCASRWGQRCWRARSCADVYSMYACVRRARPRRCCGAAAVSEAGYRGLCRAYPPRAPSHMQGTTANFSRPLRMPTRACSGVRSSERGCARLVAMELTCHLTWDAGV